MMLLCAIPECLEQPGVLAFAVAALSTCADLATHARGALLMLGVAGHEAAAGGAARGRPRAALGGTRRVEQPARYEGDAAFGGAEEPSGLHLLPRPDDATSGEEGEEGGDAEEEMDRELEKGWYD